MLDIKVLGPGCDNCKKVEALAKQAVANLGVEAAIEKIIDRAEYPKYGLLYTPGLVINNKLVPKLNRSRLRRWLRRLFVGGLGKSG